MDINELRKEIDKTNSDMLNLFIKRMELSQKIAEYKRENSLPVTDKKREREILSNVTENAGEYANYVHRFFSTLFELSKARQNELNQGGTKVHAQVEKALQAGEAVFPRRATIACQGIEGANSQAACERLFPQGNIMFFSTFEAVAQAVESGICEFGILPIENSSNGSVRAVFELLRQYDVSVVRSTRICIRHELLAAKGTKLSDIKEICSHEQALGQCSAFLSTLKNVDIKPCENTAFAAKKAAENHGVAAIASHDCKEIYGLETLNDRIQNSENNYTRFICITKEAKIYAGANRISLIFTCENKPGSLFEILSKLSALGLNMTKLESYPVVGRSFEFMFFVEFEASVLEKGVLGMLDDMERSCDELRFTGCYSEI